jgi:hypothetical protein
VAHTDEYSSIIPPNEIEDEKTNKKYGLSSFIFMIVGIYSSIYFLFWSQKISYPLDVGDRDFFDMFAAIPIVFEFTVLSVVLGIFIVFLCGKGVFKFEKAKEDERIILIEKVYSVDLLKTKLAEFNADIR